MTKIKIKSNVNENPEIRTFKEGDIFIDKHDICRIYVLSQIAGNAFALIAIANKIANRMQEGIIVEDSNNISEKELQKMYSDSFDLSNLILVKSVSIEIKI